MKIYGEELKVQIGSFCDGGLNKLLAMKGNKVWKDLPSIAPSEKENPMVKNFLGHFSTGIFLEPPNSQFQFSL